MEVIIGVPCAVPNACRCPCHDKTHISTAIHPSIHACMHACMHPPPENTHIRAHMHTTHTDAYPRIHTLTYSLVRRRKQKIERQREGKREKRERESARARARARASSPGTGTKSLTSPVATATSLGRVEGVTRECTGQTDASTIEYDYMPQQTRVARLETVEVQEFQLPTDTPRAGDFQVREARVDESLRVLEVGDGVGGHCRSGTSKYLPDSTDKEVKFC